MLSAFYPLARTALFALEPEAAHEATLKALECGIYPRGGVRDPVLHQKVFGLDFPNPVGNAAGFDKNARVPDAIIGLGCGFAEVGTLTPLAQPGNPKPRVFRLIADDALINRLAFNNDGHAPALKKLEARRGRGNIVGVNIGANKDAADRAADYVRGIDTFYDFASYFTINISSPNTPGLRDLQAPEALDKLLTRVMDARKRRIEAGAPKRPIVIKIAPDLAEDEISEIAALLVLHGVDGIAVSNTTLSRFGVKDVKRDEMGGLSGRPLFQRATIMLARIFMATEGKVPLIGIGGIDSGRAALDKIAAGATLLQLYTGLVYQGPGLIDDINRHLAVEAKKAGGLFNIRGRDAEIWAKKSLD